MNLRGPIQSVRAHHYSLLPTSLFSSLVSSLLASGASPPSFPSPHRSTFLFPWSLPPAFKGKTHCLFRLSLCSQLVLTVGLLAVVVYLYTVVAFNFFRKFYNKSEDDDEPDMKCDDMMTVSPCGAAQPGGGRRAVGRVAAWRQR